MAPGQMLIDMGTDAPPPTGTTPDARAQVGSGRAMPELSLLPTDSSRKLLSLSHCPKTLSRAHGKGGHFGLLSPCWAAPWAGHCLQDGV